MSECYSSCLHYVAHILCLRGLNSKQDINATLEYPEYGNKCYQYCSGPWLLADGSSWSKVIPILRNAGHQVVVVQLPLHSVADDVATVKRALERLGGPIILVGHSYGGFVITNAAYNNPNVTGLVYVAALAPDEGESLNDFVKTWPKDFLENIKQR